MVLSIEERVFLVENVLRSNDEYTEEVKQKFTNQFPNQTLPHRNAVRRLLEKFRETGSVCDLPRAGRPKVLTEHKLNEISDAMAMSPTKSLRRLSQQVGVSLGSSHTAVRAELKFYPYRISCFQELKECDYAKRLNYCNWFNHTNSTDGILGKTWFTDEAWFYLSGAIHSQNSRIWSTENPLEYHEKPLHSAKVGVWCAISRSRIVGPIFFHDTINSERYCEQIIHPFTRQLTEQEIQTTFFQQDGATAHTSNATLNVLREFFGERIISKGLWPPRSPDLSPPDYFLWGAAKQKVYKNKPHTLAELEGNIQDYISNIDNEQLNKVFENMKKRINLCIQLNGHHFQHML